MKQQIYFEFEEKIQQFSFVAHSGMQKTFFFFFLFFFLTLFIFGIAAMSVPQLFGDCILNDNLSLLIYTYLLLCFVLEFSLLSF